MIKSSQTEIKEFFLKTMSAKENGESLSRIFEEFAKKTGRAKGSVRNFYYSSIKRAEEDENFRQRYFGGKEISSAKIIVFNKAEAELLLERILIGQTFGKSVRRVIAEMTQNPRIALRYQNKYRNLLKHNRQLVLKTCDKIIEEYGKCYNPYKIKSDEEVQITALKKEINLLCERIALKLKDENLNLRKKLEDSQRENEFLKSLVKSQGGQAPLSEDAEKQGVV